MLKDHIIAYNPSPRTKKHKRLGITVKSRTRDEKKKEKDSVNIFKQNNDRQKVLDACLAFAREPWLAIYVEAENHADMYLTSLSNYDAKYRRAGRAIDDWKMSPKYQKAYASDQQVKHIKIEFQEVHWTW